MPYVVRRARPAASGSLSFGSRPLHRHWSHGVCCRFRLSTVIVWPHCRAADARKCSIPRDSTFAICKRGQFLDLTNGTCMACPLGEAQPNEDSTRCDRCINLGDYYQGLKGQPNCTKCPAGTYRPAIPGLSEAINQSVCRCLPGFYSPNGIYGEVCHHVRYLCLLACVP